MARWKDFIKGLKADFPSVEKALCDKRITPDRRLIDLKSPDIIYDAEGQTVTLPPEFEGGNPFTVLVNPQFHDYMERYGDNVRYITHHGTPWLTEQERGNTGQLADYFRALKRGEKRDLAIINWRKTDPRKTDSGHAALSVGYLDFEDNGTIRPKDIGPDGNLLPKPENIDGYEPQFTGSYYPSSSGLWIDKHSHNEHKNAMNSRVAADDPKAHAAGLVTRNAALPTGVAAATALMGGFASRNAASTAALTAKLAGVTTLAYTVGRMTTIAKRSTGSVLEKEEKRGHGILATLITPAQRDIMEHLLHGMNKTYFSKYQIWSNNCADFTEHVMKEIGLNTEHLVERAMRDEPEYKSAARRAVKSLTIPSHIRPGRHQWAARKLQGEDRMQTAGLQVDGEDFVIRSFKITGQSALLIETENEEIFKDKPLETLSKVLKSGVGLEPAPGARGTEFRFRPEAMQIADGGQNAGMSR